MHQALRVADEFENWTKSAHKNVCFRPSLPSANHRVNRMAGTVRRLLIAPWPAAGYPDVVSYIYNTIYNSNKGLLSRKLKG